MPEIEITTYSNEYQLDVVNLILNIQQNEFKINISLDDQEDIKDVSKFYLSNKSNFWVAKYENKAVGTIALLDIGFGNVALRKMFVKSEFRGKPYNVGQKLLNTAIKWALEKEINTIFLGTTDKFLAAHRFYEKNNFKEINKSTLPLQFPIMKIDSKFYEQKLPQNTIEYQTEKGLSVEEFRTVLINSTLGERRPIDEPERLSKMLEYGNLIITARIEGKLIGVARSLTDFLYCTYLSDLAIDVNFQKMGIGKELIRLTKLATPQAKLILLSAPKAVTYYPKIGMTKWEECYVLNDVNDLI